MKVHTLRGTWDIDIQHMKCVRPSGQVHELLMVPSPVVGERMRLETEAGVETTEPVTEVRA